MKNKATTPKTFKRKSGWIIKRIIADEDDGYGMAHFHIYNPQGVMISDSCVFYQDALKTVRGNEVKKS